MLEPLHLRNVRMAVDDRGAVREPGGQASLAANPRPRNVDHPDPSPAYRHDVLMRQGLLQGRLVHVPVDAFDRRTERGELVEEPGRDEVAAVQDEIGAAQPSQALLREDARSSREMRVGDDGDTCQPDGSIAFGTRA